MGDPVDSPEGDVVPSGVWAAVDVGKVRVGVAATDPEGLMAFPVETVSRGEDTADRIAEIVTERGVVAVFVGLPLTLSGEEGVAARDARGFAGSLSQRLSVPVRLADERLSTSAASTALREAGWDTRRQRPVIDQAAAVVILEAVLDGRKNGILDSLTKPVAQGES
jgi:putative Holliday junction resolvase